MGMDECDIQRGMRVRFLGQFVLVPRGTIGVIVEVSEVGFYVDWMPGGHPMRHLFCSEQDRAMFEVVRDDGEGE